MKISPQVMVSSHVFWLSALLSSAVLATGCQSTLLAKNNTMTANQTPMAAKTALAEALQQQRRQSFAYHSNIEMNNQRQFMDVESRSLVVAEDASAHCETVHDNGYIDLLAQAEAQGKESDDADFADQRRRLKHTYLECDKAYEAWATHKYGDEYGYEEDDFENSYRENDDDALVSPVLSPSIEAYGNAGTTIIETSTLKGGVVNKNTVSSATPTGVVSPYYQQQFDDYDHKSSALAIKKSKLLDAYLLQPLSINAQGIYQPLAGRFTMLGSVQYQTRHHKTNINQPIYVDFKTGSIYFWADNFAMLTSEVIDDKLGTQWQNKWLKLEIDDGSLPKGFGRTFIKSHFEALDYTYESAPVTQFDFIAPTTLTALVPKLPEHQLDPMRQSTQIIRRVQSPEHYEQFYQEYMTHLYKRISSQYPELIDDPSTSLATSIANGEPLTTKAIVTQALATMQTRIAYKTQAAIEKDAVNDDAISSAVTRADDSRGTIQTLYGLNHRGQIQWQHLRQQANDKQGLTADVLQQYTPISAQTLAFPNLPTAMQIPNASNSVDMRDYSKALLEYYRAGHGTTIGKTIFNRLPATIVTAAPVE